MISIAQSIIPLLVVADIKRDSIVLHNSQHCTKNNNYILSNILHSSNVALYLKVVAYLLYMSFSNFNICTSKILIQSFTLCDFKFFKNLSILSRHNSSNLSLLSLVQFTNTLPMT